MSIENGTIALGQRNDALFSVKRIVDRQKSRADYAHTACKTANGMVANSSATGISFSGERRDGTSRSVIEPNPSATREARQPALRGHLRPPSVNREKCQPTATITA